MTNPQDPRTPQERAYALDEMSDASPSEDADSTRVLHTTDPTEAYGRPVSNPTVAYTDYDPRWAPDGTAPTQAIPQGQGYPTQGYQPTAQGYQPTQAYPVQGYPPAAPPIGPVPAEPAPDGPGGSPRGPRWGLLALAAFALVALGAVVGLLLSRGDDTPSRVASGPPPTVAPPSPPSPAPVVPSPDASPSLPLDGLPGGLGEIMGDNGAVVGTITSNDGSSIDVSVVGGSTVTVLITPDTEIITLAGNTAAGLEVGATAVATGTPVEQGRMTAETVISASIPSFDGPGR